MSPNLLINNQILPSIEILHSILHWVFPYSEFSPPWVKILAPPLPIGHFQLRMQFLLVNRIGNSFIQLAIVNHKNCYMPVSKLP